MTGITRVDGGVRTEREVAQLAFKKAIRMGRCTLKELIDHFFVIEERHMIEQFMKGMQKAYAEAKVYA